MPRYALEQLYQAFAPYQRPEHIDTCACCRGPHSLKPLYARPLRSLTPEHLHLYTFRAITTMGGIDDFKHFLPRILELLHDDEFLSRIDPQVVLGKLRYAGWEQWPVAEQAAVRAYLDILWRFRVRSAPSAPVTAGDWLCAIARAENDIGPYLEAWIADSSPMAQHQLLSFVEDYQPEIATGQHPADYWEDAAEQWKQVAAWARNISRPPPR